MFAHLFLLLLNSGGRGFEDGMRVIVEGRIGPDGILYASTLMTSCPSKYQDEKKAAS